MHCGFEKTVYPVYDNGISREIRFRFKKNMQ